MYKFAALAAMLALTGCASITGKKVQPLAVTTMQGDKEVAGIGCYLSNDAGSWSLTSPASVNVHKSTGDLAIECKSQGLTGTANLVSKANILAWGNIVLGGPIGYVVDRSTGAGFNYPTNVTILLREMDPARKPAAPVAAAPAVAPVAVAQPAPKPAAKPVAKPAVASAAPAPAPPAAPTPAATPAKPVIPVAAGNPFVEGTMAEANPDAQR